jgi:hypothetical protein
MRIRPGKSVCTKAIAADKAVATAFYKTGRALMAVKVYGCCPAYIKAFSTDTSYKQLIYALTG